MFNKFLSALLMNVVIAYTVHAQAQEIDASKPTNFYTQLINNLEYISKPSGGNQIELPEAVWEPFEDTNCHLEVCFPVRLGDLFDFPYREVWPTLETMVDRIGANRLLWGTDMPFQNRFCTYQQSRDWIENYCNFLSQADLMAIMGLTAGRILNV